MNENVSFPNRPTSRKARIDRILLEENGHLMRPAEAYAEALDTFATHYYAAVEAANVLRWADEELNEEGERMSSTTSRMIPNAGR